jgi:hypothetical protein
MSKIDAKEIKAIQNAIKLSNNLGKLTLSESTLKRISYIVYR